MKAAVLTQGKTLEVMEVEKPVIGAGECLIKVAYAGICGSDVHIYGGHHPTAKKPPIIMCHEFVGEVVEIKDDGDSDLKVGDKVVVEPLISCGKCMACKTGNWHVCRSLKLIGIHVDGAFAEYVKADIEKVVKLGDIPMDVGILTEPLAVGLHVVRRSALKIGQSVLIIGSGPIGLVIGIMAKLAGASEIVISEGSKKRIEFAEKLGFKAVDAFAPDAVQKLNDITDGNGFDVVYEVTGTRGGITTAISACKIRGTMVHVGFPSGNIEVNPLPVIFKELTVVGSRVYSMEDFIATVDVEREIIRNNTFDLKSIISDVMTLDELPKAMDMMTAGENLSKIVIKL